MNTPSGLRVAIATFLSPLLFAGPAWAEVTVHVRDEAPLAAAVAAWRPYGQILVVFRDGTDRIVSAHRVLKVVDGSGADRTRFLMYGRGFVGEYPEAYRGSRSAKPSHSRGFLAFAGTTVGV